MDLSTITVADFKTQFPRDFPYLPVYDAAELYNTGDKVYYAITKLFYVALVNGITGVTPDSDPTKWEVQATTSDNVDNYVSDADITRAFAEAQVVFNQALWSSDANITLGYLYLTAHYLVNDLRAAMGGISANVAMPLSSRKVGNVAETYEIPAAYTEDPVYAFYLGSPYGVKYLSLIWSKLRGNIGVVCGATLP